MRAKTDSGSEATFDPARPGITNLLEIYQALAGETAQQVEAHFAGRGYGDVKREVADRVIAALEPLQEGHRRYVDDPAELDRQLQQGRDRAAAIGEPTLRDVQEKIGIR
jgi:tryptophanyl-tRNA synthetase